MPVSERTEIATLVQIKVKYFMHFQLRFKDHEELATGSMWGHGGLLVIKSH